ncbi:CotH kinase family protein [Ruminococcaceae bacterium OttesenSCG-928-A16]|nr:CotH kinase family protein [Ruminococcaceae bacterium OttesenSCG-928-A16]
MIKSKYITVIVAVAVCLALAGSLVLFAYGGQTTTQITDYETRLFNGEVVAIDIVADEEDWSGLLANAQAKEYIAADVTINGELFASVGIRTKGNSSLSQVAGSENQRYSLQLNPNKYVKGQSFYGLDTMCLNNLLGDATYMKDYISYDIMEYLGVPTPLRNYAKVTVNGEDYGLCLLLERYDDSFLNRTYNATAGELYNVKQEMGGNGGGLPNFGQRPTWQAGADDTEENSDAPANGLPTVNQMEPPADGAAPPMEGTEPPTQEAAADGQTQAVTPPTNQTQQATQPAEQAEASEEPEAQQRGGMSASGGGGLLYTDDDPDSYGSIFNNAVSGKVSDNDKKQIITAIQKLNAGEDLETYWDVDEILRYFAAHTFVVNLDSYVSNMQQNYYLYEREGKISILPWDYNLAFGGFNSGNASEVVNFPVDTPVSGVTMEDRPLLNQLLAVEEYSEKYHQYLNELVEGYVNSGMFETAVNQLDAQINTYVQNDANAFFTYEEYEQALPVLKQLVLLRAQSVAGQLEGSIPSTTEGQAEDSGTLVDASSVTLSALGSMGGGFGGNKDRAEGEGGMPGMGAGTPGEPTDDTAAPAEDIGALMKAAQSGTLTEEQQARLQQMGITEEQIAQFGQMAAGGGWGGGGAMPEGMDGGTGGQAATLLTGADWLMYGVLGVLLLAGLLFMVFAKRRRWVSGKK